MTSPDSSPSVPIRPDRLRFEIEESGDTVRISKHRRQLAGGCFLSFWLAGWTVGCVFLAGAFLQKGELFLLLFAIPFWASWLFAAALLAAMLLQREEVVLDSDGLSYTRRVFVPLQQRTIPLQELVRIECSESTNFQEDDAPVSYVEVLNRGSSLLMLSHLPHANSEWAAWTLNQHLLTLQGRHANRDRASRVVDPPSDCSWQLEEDYDGVVITQRGKIVLLPLLVSLFLCLFWNGIVSVFVLSLAGLAPGKHALPGEQWWFLFFFLIPFELIGLALFGFLLSILLEPFRRVRWRLTRQELSCRWSWFGVGWTFNYDATSVVQVDLEVQDGVTGFAMSRRSFVQTTSTESVILQLLDVSEQPVAAIKGLTLGEAEWIRDRIAPVYER